MMRNKVTENSKGLRLGSFDQIRGIIDEEMEDFVLMARLLRPWKIDALTDPCHYLRGKY
jgi:hypothetical protein